MLSSMADDEILYLVMVVKSWDSIAAVHPLTGQQMPLRGDPEPGLKYWCPVFDSLEAAQAYVGDNDTPIMAVRARQP